MRKVSSNVVGGRWSVVGVLHFYRSVIGFCFRKWSVVGVLISIWLVVGGWWLVVGGWWSVVGGLW